MYERFTDRARKVMQLANQEALRLNREYVGTEHILLGLVKEGSGVAANVLKNLDIDLRKIRLETETIAQHAPGGEQVVMGRQPHTPRAKRVFENAIAAAEILKHNYVGTEHLLLGLLGDAESPAAQILTNLGVKPEDVRRETLALLGKSGGEAPAGERPAAQPPEQPKQPERWVSAGTWQAGALLTLPGGVSVTPDPQLLALRDMLAVSLAVVDRMLGRFATADPTPETPEEADAPVETPSGRHAGEDQS